MIKAIIFDFDGTIIDTETAWYVAFKENYRKYDVELTLQQYAQCIGTNLLSFNPYEYLMTDLGLTIDRDSFRKEVHEHHSFLMKQEQIRPGIIQYLEMAKEANLKIGLASSSRRDWVETFLEQLKIKHYFDCIRTADDVKNVKPDPELYLQALQCLGVNGKEAVAIEDSPNGAKAAIAANMHCVVTPNSITQFLEFDRYSHKAESLDSLDFDEVIYGRAEE